MNIKNKNNNFKKINNKDVRYYHDDSKLVNYGKKAKITRNWEYGLYVPICPLCGELAYEPDYCVFCGCEFIPETEEEKINAKTLNNEYEVNYKTIRLYQCGTSLYTYQNHQLISHASLSHPYSKEELEELAKNCYESLNIK